jgi:hypothetical protein
MLDDKKNGMANGWSGYGKLVLAELERLNKNVKEVEKSQQKIQIEIAMLKVKSGVWGAIAGAIPATVVAIYIIIKSL